MFDMDVTYAYLQLIQITCRYPHPSNHGYRNGLARVLSEIMNPLISRKG